MKKFIIALFTLLLFQNCCLAIQNTAPQPTMQVSNNIKPYYLNYYNYDSFDIKMSFKPITKEDYKKLDKPEQKLYKTYSKFERLLQKGKYYKVLSQDIKFLPAWVDVYNKSFKNNNIQNRINSLINIKLLDKYNLFDKYVLNTNLAYAYMANKNYKEAAVILYELLKIKEDNFLRYELALAHFNLSEYQKTLNDIVKIPKNFSLYTDCLEMKYLSFFNLNNLLEAHKIANQLYLISYPDKYTASIRVVATTKNDDIKLKYLNIAKDNAQTDKEKYVINLQLALIYDNKIEQIMKSTQGYFKIRTWSQLIENDLKYMSLEYENKRFDKYLSELKTCIGKYKGNNFKNCLNDIYATQEKISHKLYLDEQERQRRLLELQRIQQMQMINANLQYQNNLIRQQNYELSRPRYYNSTTTQYGNTYYTNTYRY